LVSNGFELGSPLPTSISDWGLGDVECAKFDECNDWLMFRFLVNVAHGGLGSNGEIRMISISCGSNFTNSPIGSSS